MAHFFPPREVINKLSKYCAKQNLQKFYDPSEMLEKKSNPFKNPIIFIILLFPELQTPMHFMQ